MAQMRYFSRIESRNRRPLNPRAASNRNFLRLVPGTKHEQAALPETSKPDLDEENACQPPGRYQAGSPNQITPAPQRSTVSQGLSNSPSEWENSACRYCVHEEEDRHIRRRLFLASARSMAQHQNLTRLIGFRNYKRTSIETSLLIQSFSQQVGRSSEYGSIRIQILGQAEYSTPSENWPNLLTNY